MDVSAVLQALQKKGYTARFFKTKKEACDYLFSTVEGERIGFGGSATLDELGLFELLSEKNEVLWHWRCPAGTEPGELRRRAAACELYFSSVNAMSEDGVLVNIDGTANRVAATLYGHKKVFFICGTNKLCKTEEDAVFRARNVAAPENTRRLGLNTPCAKTGRCHNCDSPERICRALTVLWEKPTGADMEVLLIGETLGF